MPTVAEAVSRRGLHPDVVVHRIVHGSAVLIGPQRADDALLARLRAEAHLDPLHLPRQLAVVDEARSLWPEAAVVLCPDSVFHRGLPDEAVALPLPPRSGQGPGCGAGASTAWPSRASSTSCPGWARPSSSTWAPAAA